MLGPVLELDMNTDKQSTIVLARHFRVRGDLYSTLLGLLILATIGIAALSLLTGMPTALTLTLSISLGSFTVGWFVWVQWQNRNLWYLWNDFLVHQLSAEHVVDPVNS